MGNNQLEEDEDLFVTLTLEDDSEVDCLVVSIFEAEAEFMLASQAFDQLVEDGEYDEIIEEEENLH